MFCGVGESGVSGRRGLVVGNTLDRIVTKAGNVVSGKCSTLFYKHSHVTMSSPIAGRVVRKNMSILLIPRSKVTLV